jgi:hypothetical protein
MAPFSSRAAAAALTIPSMVLWMRSRCCAAPRLERQGSGESSRASVVLKSHQPADFAGDIRVHEAHEFGELLGIGRCDQQVVVIREDDAKCTTIPYNLWARPRTPRMASLIGGVGFQSSRPWTVRVVTSTRVPGAGR